jgi:hypothetical protein
MGRGCHARDEDSLMAYICLMDEAGREVPGSRRQVDHHGDRAGYIAAHAELTRLAGEGCWIFDSERDG